MLNKLNTLLADLVVEYHKLQNFHWYVKGSDFFQAHAKLEELYDDVNDEIDEVAEKILMVGGQPLASLKDFLEASCIEEAKNEYKTSEEVFKEVLKDFEHILAHVISVKEAADKENSYLISAYADELIGHFSKAIWMIKQRSK